MTTDEDEYDAGFEFQRRYGVGTLVSTLLSGAVETFQHLFQELLVQMYQHLFQEVLVHTRHPHIRIYPVPSTSTRGIVSSTLGEGGDLCHTASSDSVSFLYA